MTAVSPGLISPTKLLLQCVLVATAFVGSCGADTAATAAAAAAAAVPGNSSESKPEPQVWQPLQTMAPKNMLKKKAVTKKDEGSGSSQTAVKAKAKSALLKTRHGEKVASAICEAYSGQIDRWAGKRQAKCTSCNQLSSTIDRHSPEAKPKFVHSVQWRETTLAATAAAPNASAADLNKIVRLSDLKYPSGHECYPCYNMRRKFHQGKTQEELNTDRSNDQELDDLCNEQRHDAVGEKGELAGANKNQKVTVGETSLDFAKRMVTGTFSPIWEFAEKRQLVPQPNTLDALVTLIENKYPSYRVVVNEEDVVGVEIGDQTGGEYRYERGANQLKKYEKQEKFESDECAKEHFMVLNAKTQCEADDRVLSDVAARRAVSPRGAALASSNASTAAASSAPRQQRQVVPWQPMPGPVPVISIEESQVVDDQFANTLVDAANFNASRLPLRRSLGAAASRAASTIAGDQQDEQQDGQGNGLEWEGQSEASAVTQGTPGGSTGKAKRSAIEREIEEGQKAMDSVLQDFGADHHLEHSRQTKSCDAAISRLKKWARKIGRSKEREHQNFSQTMYDVADEIEQRQSLFDDAKDKIATVVMEVPSKPRHAILSTMSSTTLCSLIGREGASTSLSTAALTNSTEAQSLFLLLSGPESARQAQGLGLHLVRGANQLVKDTQRPCLHNHLEKVFKSEDNAKMSSAIQLFTFVLANQPEPTLIQKLESVPDKIEDGDKLLDGWCPQLWADICCTFVMGEVSNCIANRTQVPQALQTLCRAVVDARNKLSGRVRCYHKHIGGVSHAARDTWAKMEEVSQQEVVSSKFVISIDVVETWTVDLRMARLEHDSDPIALLCALGETICGVTGLRVVEFAKWLVWAETNLENVMSEEVFRMGLCLRGEMLECAATVIRNANYHNEVMDILTPATAVAMGAKRVRDKAFFDDSDNLPDAPAMCAVTAELGAILSMFPGTADEVQLLKLVRDRGSMLLETWKLSHYDITSSHTVFQHIRGFAELSKKYLLWKKPVLKPQTRENCPYYTLDFFVDKATASNLLPNLFKDFVETSLCQDTAKLSSFATEVHAVLSYFPTSMEPLIKAVNIINEVEELASRLKSRNGPTIIEINSVLHDGVKCTVVLPKGVRRQKFEEAKLSLGKELGTAFALFESKINRMVHSCAAIELKGGAIMEEIQKWEFKTCKFVLASKDKPDKEMIAAAKGIESAVQGFENMQTVASELDTKHAHQPESLRGKIQSINAAFQAGTYYKALDKARALLGNTMVANAVMTSETPLEVASWPKAAKKVLDVIMNNFRVDPKKIIDNELWLKVTGQAGQKPDDRKTGQKPDGKKRLSTCSSSTASTAVPPDSQASVASGASKGLKFRKKAA